MWAFKTHLYLTKEMTDVEQILTVYRRVRDEIEAFVKNMKKVSGAINHGNF
jgi:hypothetical protein